MAHTHSHQHDSDTYYLDQLCLIALSGAFAGVCLTMYFWQPHMLRLMLAQPFHKFVLWSGLALLVLVLVRSITLWRAVGRQQQHAHDHASDHAHDHDHDHAHGHHHHHAHGQHSHEAGHSHAAVAEAPCPALPHEHGHEDCSAHEQDPEDGCCGHDHGWAPWRYVILLLPIMLYLLGLPSQPPSATGGAVSVDLNEEAQLYAGLVGAGMSPLGSLAFAGRASGDRIDGPAKQVGLKELEGAAFDPVLREHWQGQVIRVVGQFAPDPRSDRVFQLVRYRIQCCAADAIPVRIPGLCRKSLAGVRPNAWVQVTGRVAFQETQPGTFVTFLQVPGRQLVAPTDPDPNPYIQ